MTIAGPRGVPAPRPRPSAMQAEDVEEDEDDEWPPRRLPLYLQLRSPAPSAAPTPTPTHASTMTVTATMASQLTLYSEVQSAALPESALTAYAHRDALLAALHAPDAAATSATNASSATSGDSGRGSVGRSSRTQTQSVADTLNSYALHTYMHTLSVKAQAMVRRWFLWALGRSSTSLQLSLHRHCTVRRAALQFLRAYAQAGAATRLRQWKQACAVGQARALRRWRRWRVECRVQGKTEALAAAWRSWRCTRQAVRCWQRRAKTRARRRSQGLRGDQRWSSRRKVLSMLLLQAGAGLGLRPGRRGGVICRLVARSVVRKRAAAKKEAAAEKSALAVARLAGQNRGT